MSCCCCCNIPLLPQFNSPCHSLIVLAGSYLQVRNKSFPVFESRQLYVMSNNGCLTLKQGMLLSLTNLKCVFLFLFFFLKEEMERLQQNIENLKAEAAENGEEQVITKI